MSDRYRNQYTAFGLILGISLAFNIVGWLSVGFDWVGLQKARTDTHTYAEKQCARQQAERARANRTILQTNEAPSPEPRAGNADSSEHPEPDWCDLAAQQSMADSTVGMEQAAWVALGLTAVGVILVWRTLYYTRETLKEAQSATRTAVANVDVTRKIGEAQVRAYISIISVTAKVIYVEEDVVSFSIRVLFKNIGQSPALDATISTKSENQTDVKSRLEIGDIGSGVESERKIFISNRSGRPHQIMENNISTFIADINMTFCDVFGHHWSVSETYVGSCQVVSPEWATLRKSDTSRFDLVVLHLRESDTGPEPQPEG